MSNEYISTVKFCNVCGLRFKKQDKTVLICDNSHRFYINPKICVGVLLFNLENKILLVKRNIEPKKGFWDIPGGFVEVDENLEQATQRELSEELNIQAKELEYFSSTPDYYYYQKVPYPTLNAFFVGKLQDGTIKLDDEISSYDFFELDKIPYDEIAFESIKEVLVTFTNTQLK